MSGTVLLYDPTAPRLERTQQAERVLAGPTGKVVGFIDNALAPRLVGKGMQVHPLFVVLAIFGGISYFGPLGIFLGPLTLSLLFALLSVYGPADKLQ